VIAGVGAGYRDVEFDAFGIPKHQRVPRLQEGIELLRLLLSQTNVTYEGEYYAVSGVTTSPRPNSTPPIWLAANATPAVERAARLADAWFVNPHATLEELADQKKRYDAIRRRDDADTAVPVFREAVVAETRAAAEETAQEFLAPKYERYLSWGQDEAMDDGATLHGSFEELREDRFLIGTPADVVTELERYDAALDISHAILRTHWPGMPAERSCLSIELLADQMA
ncbi:MAG: LLM class flavin-dependent oxidoreductase, partial [Salinirussus sp.]